MLVAERIVLDWTLVDDDKRLVVNKAGATRLGFAVMLKYFQLQAMVEALSVLNASKGGYVLGQLAHGLRSRG